MKPVSFLSKPIPAFTNSKYFCYFLFKKMNKHVGSKGPRGNKLVSSEKKNVNQEIFGMLMI